MVIDLVQQKPKSLMLESLTNGPVYFASANYPYCYTVFKCILMCACLVAVLYDNDESMSSYFDEVI